MRENSEMAAWKDKASNNFPKVTDLLALSKKTYTMALVFGMTLPLKPNSRENGPTVNAKNGWVTQPRAT